jgi:hypothetical protein
LLCNYFYRYRYFCFLCNFGWTVNQIILSLFVSNSNWQIHPSLYSIILSSIDRINVSIVHEIVVVIHCSSSRGVSENLNEKLSPLQTKINRVIASLKFPCWSIRSDKYSDRFLSWATLKYSSGLLQYKI